MLYRVELGYNEKYKERERERAVERRDTYGPLEIDRVTSGLSRGQFTAQKADISALTRALYLGKGQSHYLHRL